MTDALPLPYGRLEPFQVVQLDRLTGRRQTRFASTQVEAEAIKTQMLTDLHNRFELAIYNKETE